MKLKFFSFAGLLVVLWGAFTPLENSLLAFDPIPDTPEQLGKILFEDKILSSDYSLSCASCHIPAFAFADTLALSLGVEGQQGTRNTPSSMNMLMRESFFWDGRAATLEAQALMPIENPIEMNLPLDSAIARLRENIYYQEAFLRVYGKVADKDLLANAIASFERTLETGSDYDRFADGDSSAISAAALRGLDVFNEKGKCFDCHFGPDMTGDEFRNIGTFNALQYNDAGRFDFTKDSVDLGKFKTPSLRNVAVTAPYMHDGSFATLREVIEYYNEPDKFRPDALNRDSLLAQPLGLTHQEMDDLEAFLITLTADQYMPLVKK